MKKIKKLFNIFRYFKNPFTVIGVLLSKEKMQNGAIIIPRKGLPVKVGRLSDSWIINKILNGGTIKVQGGDIIENGFYLRQGTSDTYMYNESLLHECCAESLKRINKDSVVVDLGAHIGLYSSRVAPYCKKVYAYEAVRENYIQGLKNVEGKNIDFFNIAVWSICGQMPYSGDGNVLKIGEGQKMTETITLEKILENIEKCDLIKIDIEGCEYEVLLFTPDSVFKKIKSIYLELHPHIIPNKNEEVVKLLERNNYKVTIRNVCGWEVLVADKL